MKPIFITTPIYYANSKPHIGHIYSTLIADSLARWHKMIGHPVFFTTGTDVHGAKVQKAAQKANLSPKTFVDSVSSEFKSIFSQVNIQFDHFIQTNDPYHKETVQEIWNEMIESKVIVKGKHSGWYSTQEEAFIPENDLVSLEDGSKSTQNGLPVEFIQEENYLFKLKAQKKPLQKWLANHPIRPIEYEADCNSYVNNPDMYLDKLSVSRPKNRVSWGITVPNNDDQTMYVWFEALFNYLSSAKKLNQPWPPTFQIIGKDILRFHGIFWPSFLASINLDMPEKLICHGHWTMNGEKMSKSIGNVIDPTDLVNQFGTDPFRYFLLTDHSLGSDGDFSYEKLVESCNSFLTNSLGNLITRIFNPKLNILDQTGYNVGKYGSLADLSSQSQELSEIAKQFANPQEFIDLYSNADIFQANRKIQAMTRSLNRYINVSEPWFLDPQNDSEKLEKILAISVEGVRIINTLIYPFTPETSSRIAHILGYDDPSQISSIEYLNFGHDIIPRNLPAKKISPSDLYPRLQL